MSQRIMSLEIDGHHVHLTASATSASSRLPPVVFVHGAQNDHRVWLTQLQWFMAHGYQAFAPDLPAHGQSAGAPLTTVELMGQWLTKLLQVISPVGADAPPSFILVGHSMGSLAALECAGNHGADIAALVMIGTAFPMKVSAVLLEQTRTDEAAAIAQIAQWSHALDLPDASEAAVVARSERIVAAEQLMHSQTPGVLHTDLNACNSYALGLEAAAKTTCPCLVVSGSKDQMTAPKFALRLQEALHADGATLAGAGHAMMSEQGDALCEVIQQFLSKHSLSAPVATEK